MTSARLLFAAMAIEAIFSMHCGARTDTLVEVPSVRGDAGTQDASSIGQNACGGMSPLPGAPDAPCGECGTYVCDSPERLRCVERATRNSCGQCGAEPIEECNGRDDDCNGRVDEGCAIRLAVLPTQERRVRLSGDYAVIEAGGRYSNASDIVLVHIPSLQMNILSPHARPIDGPGDPSQDRAPDLAGDWVVWIARRVDPLGSTGRITAYNILRGGVIPGPDIVADEPAVDAARVVFTTRARPDATGDIWIWYPNDGTLQPVLRSDDDEQAPSLSGDWLAYTRGTGSSPLFNRQIVVRNLRTGEEQLASEGLRGWATQPHIDGDTVVFRREEGNQAPAFRGEIWAYSLRTRNRWRISQDDRSTGARVSGSRVCFTAVSSEPGGLSVFDLRTMSSEMVSPNGTFCDIDRTRVAWTAFIGSGDAYYRDL